MVTGFETPSGRAITAGSLGHVSGQRKMYWYKQYPFVWSGYIVSRWTYL